MTIIVKHREMLVGQRTPAVNVLREHAAEFGIVVAKGCANVAPLRAALTADATIPLTSKAMFAQIGRHVDDLESKVKTLDQRLPELHKTRPTSQRLAAAHGVAPITAITMALTVNPANFERGRRFAARFGLTPRQRSTGGWRPGKAGQADNERLRQLLRLGATAVVRYVRPGSKSATAWLVQLLGRRPREAVAVALANKMARVIWAELIKVPTTPVVGMFADGLMARGEAYRRQPPAA